MASILYQYTPLSSESSIRLLRLKNYIASQGLMHSIEVDLFEVPIEDSPTFEAVSYAWDHTDARATMLCNEKQLQVSPAVVDMLINLHRISTVRVFWVDAVCIDQSSTMDKNIQVPRMRLVFSEAQRVWIWLGQGTYESKLGFDFLVEMDNLRMESATNKTTLAKSRQRSLQQYQGRPGQSLPAEWEADKHL